MSTFITEMYSINRSYYRLLTLGVDIILTNNQQILNLFNFCCMKLSLIAFTGMRDSTLTILFVLNSLLPARAAPCHPNVRPSISEMCYQMVYFSFSFTFTTTNILPSLIYFGSMFDTINAHHLDMMARDSRV